MCKYYQGNGVDFGEHILSDFILIVVDVIAIFKKLLCINLNSILVSWIWYILLGLV